MSDPFKIKGPALISFSGGRTSAYMLWRILQAHGGTLPDDVRVTFANTGKEMPQTLDFVRDCQERWGVDVVWLEYRRKLQVKDRFEIVNYETASRNGEPFAQVIKDKKFVPNPGMRFCTTELKVKPIARFACSLGMEDWNSVVGLRSDEPRRVSNMRGQNQKGENDWHYVMPLAAAGILKSDVDAFWASQNWGLKLYQNGGDGFLSNCDLCFMKRQPHRLAILKASPDVGLWWAEQEESIPREKGKTNQFRPGEPTVRQLIEIAKDTSQISFLDKVDHELADCFCGDGA